MLRPLLYLLALLSLRGAVEFSENKEFNISYCPVTFYQKVYTQLYFVPDMWSIEAEPSFSMSGSDSGTDKRLDPDDLRDLVNFTSENFVVCFNGFYNPSTADDCLLGPSSDLGFADLYSGDASYLESTVKEDVPTITNSADCEVYFEMLHNSKLVIFNLVSFGNQSALEFRYTPAATDPNNQNVTKRIDVYVDGTHATAVVVTAADKSSFIDISSCRSSGEVLSPNTTYVENETCTAVSCGLDRSIIISPYCNNGKRCDGHGSCLSTCTVTGPAIIDIHSKADFIEDCCSYTLVSDSWVSGLQILASFRERRRRDVSFVDSVTLRLEELDIDILLKHDGRVLVDNSPLTLSSSVQEVHGVKLSKDHTGVMANVTISGHSAFVFFDGDTAQIHLKEPPGSSLDGLCGNSSSFSSAKLSEDSSSSCETPYTEPADSAIDCTAVAERCNLLKEVPFSSCNAKVDPSPYITACHETLCKYPAVDGLRCQFLWAYARACSLNNATLENWWSQVDCSAPEPVCQNQVCSDHEFCGKVRGEPGCLCRAVFASKYRESNTLADSTVCTHKSASISLVGCLLRDKNINYSLLHLNDETCKGVLDEDSGMVTFSFDNSNTCGAVITGNGSQVTYKNSVMNQNSFSDVITRQDQVYIDFSCVHIQPETKTVAFRIKDSSVVQHFTSGEWNCTVTMKAYTDASRTQAVGSNTDVELDQKIWVELETEGLDPDVIAVVIDSCWATDQESSSSTPKYDLIQNSCVNAADQTVMVEGNGEGTSNYFSFSMFQFTGSSGDVYMHCKLKLCIKEGNSCVPECSDGAKMRHKSARYEGGASAFVSMAWIHEVVPMVIWTD